MDPAWVLSIRDQCHADGVSFFFKQWGGAQKSKHGRHLDGRTYDEMPQRTSRSAPPRPRRTHHLLVYGSDGIEEGRLCLPIVLASGPVAWGFQSFATITGLFAFKRRSTTNVPFGRSSAK